MSPRDSYYPADLAKTDPLVVEPIKLPASVLELLTIASEQQALRRTVVVRTILSEWAENYRRKLGADYKKLLRRVQAQAPARTAAARVTKSNCSTATSTATVTPVRKAVK